MRISATVRIEVFEALYEVALVGSGKIARNRHVPAWSRLHRDARITAVCDRNIELAETVAAALGATAYDSVGRMLREMKPDFVDICTPPDSHSDAAVRALECGAHVLVEKPLATTVEDCERLIDAERRCGGIVSVAHTELFYPNVREARRRIAAGEIGDLTGMRIFRSTPVADMTADPDGWANRLSGGVIGETGPHVVYLAQAFIGYIREVRATGRKLLPEYAWSPFEDYRLDFVGERATCSAVLTYTNGHSAAHVDIWGTRGKLRLELQSRLISRYDRSSRSPVGIGRSALSEAGDVVQGLMGTACRHLTGRLEKPHDALIREFLRSVVRRVPPPVTSLDGLETVRIMDKISCQLQSQSRRPSA